MAKLLRDKVTLVTGASRGIGRAIAVAMADEDAKVALTGRDIGRLNKVMEQIQVVGGQSDIWKMDVSSETEVEQSVNKILDSWGQIDILVNNAGIGEHCELEDVSLERLTQMLNIGAITIRKIGVTWTTYLTTDYRARTTLSNVAWTIRQEFV